MSTLSLVICFVSLLCLFSWIIVWHISSVPFLLFFISFSFPSKCIPYLLPDLHFYQFDFYPFFNYLFYSLGLFFLFVCFFTFLYSSLLYTFFHFILLWKASILISDVILCISFHIFFLYSLNFLFISSHFWPFFLSFWILNSICFPYSYDLLLIYFTASLLLFFCRERILLADVFYAYFCEKQYVCMYIFKVFLCSFTNLNNLK